MRESNNKIPDKRKKNLFVSRNEIIALFLFTALVFATLYFVQLYITNVRIRDIIEYSNSKVNSIVVVDSYYTNKNNTNNIITKEELSDSITKEIDNYRLSLNEEIKQVIKNTSDVNIFWLSFVTVIVLIFSIFTISITRDYAEKTRLYSKSLQKKIDNNKNFELKFMAELISITNQTRDICKKSIDDITTVRDNILKIENVDKLKVNKEEFETVKKEVIEDIEKNIKKLKEDTLLSFDEEITDKYSRLLGSVLDKHSNIKE